MCHAVLILHLLFHNSAKLCFASVLDYERQKLRNKIKSLVFFNLYYDCRSIYKLLLGLGILEAKITMREDMPRLTVCTKPTVVFGDRVTPVICIAGEELSPRRSSWTALSELL